MLLVKVNSNLKQCTWLKLAALILSSLTVTQVESVGSRELQRAEDTSYSGKWLVLKQSRDPATTSHSRIVQCSNNTSFRAVLRTNMLQSKK